MKQRCVIFLIFFFNIFKELIFRVVIEYYKSKRFNKKGKDFGIGMNIQVQTMKGEIIRY